jgi:hypothetical protein
VDALPLSYRRLGHFSAIVSGWFNSVAFVTLKPRTPNDRYAYASDRTVGQRSGVMPDGRAITFRRARGPLADSPAGLGSLVEHHAASVGAPP